ncbi:MAG: metallophosphoesterase [Bacteroidetes bacterium]|nr:metallophosphoesterase [Bacteroidota bacterium]
MKTTTYYLLAILFFAVSCTNDKIIESDLPADQQQAFKEVLESNEAYNAVKEKLEAYNALEAQELEETEMLQTSANTQTEEDESFVFFVIGDSELNMRGNTYPQLLNWIERINNIESYDLEFHDGNFEENEDKKITKPEIVLLAGDIVKDRAFGFSLPGDENDVAKREINRLFNQFDEDILFFPGNGNHDWDPYQWGDGAYGHNLGGLFSNLGTAQFVRSRYNKALRSTEEESGTSFNFDRNTTWLPAISSAEFNYSFVYKGLRFTQLNQFLQQPVAMLSLESLTNTGPALYYPNRTSEWFQELCTSSAENNQQHVVVQHYPINTGSSWWNDYLGSTPNELRKEFLDIFAQSHDPVMFTGHNHSYRTTTVQPYNIVDYTSGYFANGFIMVAKASAAKGIYAVSFVDLNNLTVMDPESYSSTFVVPQ